MNAREKWEARKPPPWLAGIDAAVDAVLVRRKTLETAYTALAEQRDALAKTEYYEHASIYRREGRWAYLHVRNPQGGRERRYIGIDKGKIKAAEEAIERGRKFTSVSATLAALDRDAYAWERAVTNAVHALLGGFASYGPRAARVEQRRPS